jgi:hypothetical protein
MAKILHLAHLVQHDGVAKMDVRRRRVEAELDPQRRAARKLLRDLALDDELVGATFEYGELMGYVDGHELVPKVMRLAQPVDLAA